MQEDTSPFKSPGVWIFYVSHLLCLFSGHCLAVFNWESWKMTETFALWNGFQNNFFVWNSDLCEEKFLWLTGQKWRNVPFPLIPVLTSIWSVYRILIRDQTKLVLGDRTKEYLSKSTKWHNFFWSTSFALLESIHKNVQTDLKLYLCPDFNWAILIDEYELIWNISS